MSVLCRSFRLLLVAGVIIAALPFGAAVAAPVVSITGPSSVGLGSSVLAAAAWQRRIGSTC